MAGNVFGTPITDAFLRQLPEWQDVQEITRLDRANVARDYILSDRKKDQVIAYVNDLKAQWGTGVSTLCILYNATGDPINLITNRDWFNSHVGPGRFPTRIANGQWGGFLHVKRTAAASGSIGAVVYRALNNAGVHCDFMVAWNNPWLSGWRRNTAYTEIKERGHFTGNAVWNAIESRLYNSGYVDTDAWNGCFSTVSIGRGTTVRFEAILDIK